jgi:hypothetical protein
MLLRTSVNMLCRSHLDREREFSDLARPYRMNLMQLLTVSENAVSSSTEPTVWAELARGKQL